MSSDSSNLAITTAPAEQVSGDMWRRMLFEQNAQPAWVFDVESLRFLDVNQAAIDAYGYTRDEFLNMTIADIRPKEDMPALLDSINSSDSVRKVSGEWRHLHKDGSLNYAEIASFECEYSGRRARLIVVNDVTERHRAEEALNRTIQDYRGLFENAHDAIVVISADDEKVLDVNQRACAIYGYSHGEFVGLTLAELSKDPEATRENLRQTLKRGMCQRIDAIHRRKDEEEMFLEINTSAITFKGQRAVLSINRDVTDQRLKEKALREQEQRRRLHVERTPLGVIEWDENFCITAWNPGAARIFGHTAKEAIGQHATLLIPEEARGHVAKVWEGLSTATGGLRSTNRNIAKDGRTILCEWYNTSLIDEEGRVVGAASLVHDITDSENAHAALQSSERNYRTLAEVVPAIVYSGDADGNVTYYNPRWYEYTGLSADDGIGQGWVKVVHPDDLQPMMDKWQRSRDTGGPFECELRLRRHDGEYCWFLARSAPQFDKDGRVVRWLGTSTDIHERKLAEEALAGSEARFRSFTESVGDFITVLDLEGRYLYASPKALEFTGHGADEVLEVSSYDLMHPDDRDRVRAEAHDRILRGEPVLFEWRKRHRDGSYLDVETNGSLVLDKQGRPAAILCATRDISQRKRAEREAQEKQRILQTVFDHIPVMVSFVADGRYILVNRAWEQTFQYSMEEACSRDLLPELYPNPAELNRVREFIARADGKTWGEFPTRRKDGKIVQTRWIDLRVADDGPCIGLGIDVTEQRRKEELLEQIAQNIDEIFFVMDPSSRRTLYASPAYERVWQRPVQSLLDDPKSWLDVVHIDDRKIAWSDDPTTWSREFRLTRDDGSERWVHSRAKPLRDANGEVYRVVGVTQDITERKLLEERLRRHTEEIAHEINNPLAGIDNALALLKGAVPANHRYYSYIALAQEEIRRISRIVQQVYDARRSEGKEASLFDVGQTVRDAVAIMQADADKRQVALRVAPQGMSMHVTLAEPAVRQILLNLLRNAIQASPAKSVVDVMIDGSTDRQLVISVHDRGEGISPEARPNIFNPFFTTKQSAPNAGLGLGLSVANNLAAQMGGRIEFDSALGKGSTFRLVVPLPQRAPSTGQEQ